MGRKVYTLVMCSVLLCSAKASAQGDDPIALEVIWNFPRTDFERRIFETAQCQVERFMDGIADCCEYVESDEKKYPMTQRQRDELKKVGDAAAIRFIRDAQLDMLVEIHCHKIYHYDSVPPGAFTYESLAELRIGVKASIGVLRRSCRINDTIINRWKQISTPEQWAKIMKYNSHSWEYFNNEARAELFEYKQRVADGRLTEEEFRKANIDPKGPREVTLDTIPSLNMSSSGVGLETWPFRVAAFVHRYKLTLAQQQAAQVILDDSLKKAGAYRQRHEARLQRLWKQLLTAYLFPKKSKLTVKQAMRKFRRASQNAVQPIYEKMQERLIALLTTEQKNAGGPAPPRPKWMELMEIALEDDATKPIAPIGATPTTQPAASP